MEDRVLKLIFCKSFAYIYISIDINVYGKNVLIHQFRKKADLKRILVAR